MTCSRMSFAHERETTHLHQTRFSCFEKKKMILEVRSGNRAPEILLAFGKGLSLLLWLDDTCCSSREIRRGRNTPVSALYFCLLDWALFLILDDAPPTHRTTKADTILSCLPLAKKQRVRSTLSLMLLQQVRNRQHKKRKQSFIKLLDGHFPEGASSLELFNQCAHAYSYL